MRTNIDIDDDLMDHAMRVSGERTKRGVVVQTRRQAGVRRLRGSIRWRGDLKAGRLGRVATNR